MPTPFPPAGSCGSIGKAPEDWTVDDLVGVVGKLGVRLVSLMHVGGDGWLKTLDFVPRDLQHLREVLSFGERADGSSLFGAFGISLTASDVVLRRRLSTAFIDPFASYPTLVVFCAHYGRDGAPLPESPDTIVRKASAHLQSLTGIELQALGEVEFFLGQPAGGHRHLRRHRAGIPLQLAVRLRGAAAPARDGDAGGDRNSREVRAQRGRRHPGRRGGRADREQHDIELALLPLPQAADAVLIAQWLLRNLAHKAGWRCSFDAILRRGHAGSGLHFHLSPVMDGVHRKHSTAAGQLEPVGKWLIAEPARHAEALMAFGNRTPNSFVRLTQAKEAPSTVTWGRYNRKALIRLPIVATDEEGRSVSAETVEFRLPDGSAHPHLLLAGIAQAMVAARDFDDLDSLLEKTCSQTLQAPFAIPVPRTFREVADGLRQHRLAFESAGVFPRHVVDRTIEALEQM